MELLETQDPEKKKLIETSERHRMEIERELNNISTRSEKMLKNALIIGGVLALTYTIVSQVTSGKSKRKKSKPSKETEEKEVIESSEPSILTQVGDKLLNTATLFLIDVAKEKLSDYLQTKKSKNENS